MVGLFSNAGLRCQGNGQGAVVDTDLHADGNRLFQAQAHQTRHPVPHRQTDQVEGQRGQADLRGIGGDSVPVLDHCQHDDQRQKQRRQNLYRLVHERGKARRHTPYQHANGHRPQDDEKHLQHLAKLQRQGLIGGHEVIHRQIDDDRHGQHGDHRVHRGEGNVQRHVAMSQVAVQVGTGAARRSRQQHQPHGQRRSQGKALGDEETGHRQDEDLTDQTNDHRFGVLHHPGEIRQRQRQPQAEHDDAQGGGEENGQQGIGSHCFYSRTGNCPDCAQSKAPLASGPCGQMQEICKRKQTGVNRWQALGCLLQMIFLQQQRSPDAVSQGAITDATHWLNANQIVTTGA